MSVTMEGTIEIPLEDFWKWVEKHYVPYGAVNYSYGVPRVDSDGHNLVIDFAADSELNPSDWGVKPECLGQWQKPIRRNSESARYCT